MARILGLDLGSYSVKGLVIESAMRGFQVRGYAEARRPEGADRAETLKAALAELLTKLPGGADSIAACLPGPTLVTHLISLPFNDTKRIEATIPFEIESQLPFDLSDAVYDYQPAPSKEKKSELIVGVVRKEEIDALLATLQSAQVDPRIITHPAIAFGSVFLALPPVLPGDGADPVAIVDIGHERTSVAIGTSTGIEFARTFSGGGQDLTRALATEFQIPANDAQAWKEQHGAVARAVVGPDAERAAGAFMRGIQPLLRELRQTFKAYTARTRKSPKRIYLSGGTSRLAGLDEQLAQDLGFPVQPLRLGADVQAAISAGEQPSAPEAYALALCGQASAARAPRFNLRRGALAFKGHFDYLRERLGRLAAFTAAAVLLLIVSGIVRNSLLSSRERKVDQALCEITQRVLNKCEKNFDIAISMLKGKESPAAAIPKVSAVNILAEFVARMPQDIPVTFDQIRVDLDRLSARIQTDNAKEIDKITAALKTYKCFKEVQAGKMEKSRDGQKIEMNLDVQVECPEVAHPPEG